MDHGRASASAPFLVCFAVREEAAPFRRARLPSVEILVTGMGWENARRGIEQALTRDGPAPRAVITSGFAGGLLADHRRGDVLVNTDDPGIRGAFVRSGARVGRFHCCARVAATVRAKQALAMETGADAVDMESGVIRQICREYGIPAATVRVILDPWDEDLPLDFNNLVNSRFELEPGKLAGTLFRNPGIIPRLIRLQRQSRAAAIRLADLLSRALPLLL